MFYKTRQDKTRQDKTQICREYINNITIKINKLQPIPQEINLAE